MVQLFHYHVGPSLITFLSGKETVTFAFHVAVTRKPSSDKAFIRIDLVYAGNLFVVSALLLQVKLLDQSRTNVCYLYDLILALMSDLLFSFKHVF